MNIEIGTKFGEFEVISLAFTEQSRNWWLCKCDCGRFKEIRQDRIAKCFNCGCKRASRDNIVGQVFGKLTCLEFVGKNIYEHLLWKFKCECGREKVLSGNNVKYSCTGTCGECLNKGKNSRRWTGVGDLGSSYWRNIQKAAERKNLEFAITKEYGWNLFLEQDRKCPLTGEGLCFTEMGTAYGGDGGTASIDRIDSSKGYIEGNVWWVNRDANIIKLDLTMEKLVYWAGLIVNKDNSEYNFVEPSYLEHRKDWKGYKFISGQFWSRVKTGAKKRNITFELKIEELYQKFIDQNGRCAFTNLPLFISGNNKEITKVTASVDRIDSNKPYRLDNIQFIHQQLNRMKWYLTDERFIEVMTKIYHLHKDNYGPAKNN